jgi:hypothetical protein
VISVSTFKTPTLAAMMRIGNLVETGGSGDLPRRSTRCRAAPSDPFPINPSTGNPVHCTNNYHILFTDGKTNQVTPIAIPGGDQDRERSVELGFAAAIPSSRRIQSVKTRLPLCAASAGGRQFAVGQAVQAGVPFRNTLADVATYYWARDLRPNNAPGQYPNEVPAATSNQDQSNIPEVERTKTRAGRRRVVAARELQRDLVRRGRNAGRRRRRLRRTRRTRRSGLATRTGRT